MCKVMFDIDLLKEHELLLLCTQVPFDDSERARFDGLLDDSVDWEYLIETSYAHAVTPLLCRALQLVSPSRVPSDVLAAAHTHLDDNRSRNLEVTRELMRILEGLEAAGIPAIPFKGPVLAETYYGDPGLRRYADLDFLIEKEAAAETVAILRTLGYPGSGQVSTKDKDFTLSLRQDAALWHYAGEYLFFHSDKPIAIEPHWAFVPPTLGLDLDYAAFCARARRGVLSDKDVLTLSAEDTVLSLALHGAKSYWSRIQWIADLDRAIKCESQIDWNALLDRARQAGMLRIVLVGLQLVRKLFGTVCDRSVVAAINVDPVVQTLVAERCEHLFAKNKTEISTSKISREWLRMLDFRRDKWRHVLRTSVTPRVQHFEALPLPDGLFFAYYVFKPTHDYIALPLWLAAKKLGMVRSVL